MNEPLKCKSSRSSRNGAQLMLPSAVGGDHRTGRGRLADAQSYQRGRDYYSHGHVESLEDRDVSVRAVVRGNQDYTVMLAADEGVLDYSCDCPVGSDGT